MLSTYHAVQTVSIRLNCRSMMSGSIGLQLGMILVRLTTPYVSLVNVRGRSSANEQTSSSSVIIRHERWKHAAIYLS